MINDVIAYHDRMRAADVPLRHARFRARQSTSPEWSAKLGTIKPMIGTGFLIALCGGRGPGKTQLAVELIRSVCYADKAALYRRLMEFFIDIKATYNNRAEQTESEVIDLYAAPALLVLDEAHERGGTAWEGSLLNLLIDRRYAAMQDTIIIANLTRAELPDALGPSIMRRLDDTGGIVECGWGRVGQAAGKETR
jgi:DNA replication protein DnaC